MSSVYNRVTGTCVEDIYYVPVTLENIWMSWFASYRNYVVTCSRPSFTVSWNESAAAHNYLFTDGETDSKFKLRRNLFRL